MTRFSQKDIVLVPFPFTDLSRTKKRPALIVSCRDINYNDFYNDFIAVALTSQIRNNPYCLCVDEKNLSWGNLKVRSEIHCCKIFTFQKNMIIKKLAALNNNSYDRVTEKIRSALAL